MSSLDPASTVRERSLVLIGEEHAELRDFIVQVLTEDAVPFRSTRARYEKGLAEARAVLTRMTRVTGMGEIAASIGHELSQPLAAVVANASACQRWLAPERSNVDEARLAAQRVTRDAIRASDIIARIRAFLRRSPPQRSVASIVEVIAEALSFVQSEAHLHGVSLLVETGKDLPSVLADRVQLQQVLFNLLQNSIEAITSDPFAPREVRVHAESCAPNAIVVAVSDTGPGLEPHTQDHVFEPFFTTKSDGMGMGLAISRSIVESHGGRLWVSVNEVRGVTFRFILPAVARSGP